MKSQTLNLNELWKKIEDVKIGMFTTRHADNHLVSRPMTLQEVDVDGKLWFFSSLKSDIARDLATNPAANISFAEPKDSLYVSLAGQATLITDRALYANLWNPLIKAWFPLGLDDPDLSLIKFNVETAEYWDADSSRMTQFFHIVKAAVTGNRATDLGKHGNVRL